MERRLAAVLAADVVGYSALTGADEGRTLAVLKQFRKETFGPTVIGQRGKVIKSMGDGWLVMFGSAVDAVNCALKLQERLIGHDTIKLRIGVHIGDIVLDEEDIYGDGVNVAARLQEISEPAGISISSATYGSLDGTLTPSFEDTGELKLKNIQNPLRVWSRAPAGEPFAASDRGATTDGARRGFPSLVIVPVVTSDPRGEVQDLADALTNDLEMHLGSSAWLSATIGQSSMTADYEAKAKLRARGDRLRLEVRLAAASSDRLWSKKYDGDLEEAFDWQDHVTEEVSSNLFGLIFDAEKRKISRKSWEERSATECMLNGILEYSLVDPEAIKHSLESFTWAIEKDSTQGLAYAQAVRSINSAKSAGYREAIADYLPHYDSWLEKAESFPGVDPAFQLSLAWAELHRDHDESRFRRQIEEGLRRAPFDVEVLTYSGWNYLWIGEADRAMECLRKAEKLGRISPFAVAINTGLALACVQAGKDSVAIEHALKALSISPDYPTPYRVLAAANAYLERPDEAVSALKQVLRLVPADTLSATRDRSAFSDSPGVRRYIEGLRLAGLPE